MASRWSEDENGGETIVVRKRGWQRILAIGLLGLLLLALLLIAGLWIARRPIASEILHQQFEQRGVRATYDLERVGLRTQVVRNLVIGDPEDPSQKADMLARSPITRVDDITAPVLLIHGANDVRVHRRHSDRIADALRSRGAEVEYLLNEAEGHWFINPERNASLVLIPSCWLKP